MNVQFPPAAFDLHGKTIKGTMTLGETYALDFEDGTSLWITAVRLPDRLSITAELKNEAL